MTSIPGTRPLVQLGLRENLGQFALLVIVNGFVGATLGAERSVLPLLARDAFGVVSTTATLGFLVTFGVAKATANYAAGRLSEQVGRRRVLLAGWLTALPVPFLLYWAPSWGWVVATNTLLGIHQGLAWSTTVIMKIDLVGPKRRGLALGLNEFAGYLAIALAALGGGALAGRIGPRSALLWIGLVAVISGLLLTVLFVRDTTAHVHLEQGVTPVAARAAVPATRPSGAMPSRTRWQLFAANQAGLVNNLNDGLAWGLLPLHFAAAGLSLREIGWLAALYPAVWGVAQIGTGALSDEVGRRGLIAVGMVAQGVALALMAVGTGFALWATAAVVLGLGTAAVYPTLIAQVSDLVGARERARAVGTYRLWRDLGYAVGAVLSGILADSLGLPAAILAVAVLTAGSGVAGAVMLRPARAAGVPN
jgi:MFS family permease